MSVHYSVNCSLFTHLGRISTRFNNSLKSDNIFKSRQTVKPGSFPLTSLLGLDEVRGSEVVERTVLVNDVAHHDWQ